MNIDDTQIYANGRTYAEHVAWLESLNPDENLIVHACIDFVDGGAVDGEAPTAPVVQWVSGLRLGGSVG
jgi:hypothetical protein